MKKILKIKCPTCEVVFNYYSSEFRPFCSDRCKNVDLGHWLTESYAIAGKSKMEIDLEKEMQGIDLDNDEGEGNEE